MLDDLRQVARSHDDDLQTDSYEDTAVRADDGKLFGMTAVERMFLSIGLFFVTVVISFILLVGTESIGF